MVSAVAWVQSKVRLTAMQEMVMLMADLKSCERWESSRRELMATMPATVSTTTNSNGSCSMMAQMSIIVKCVIKAVLESIKMRMNMGTIA